MTEQSDFFTDNWCLRIVKLHFVVGDVMLADGDRHFEDVLEDAVCAVFIVRVSNGENNLRRGEVASEE